MGLAANLGVTLMGRGFYLFLSSFLFVCLFSSTRTEEAEGILDPQESDKLNFNEKCIRSSLLTQLWVTAVLGSLSG